MMRYKKRQAVNHLEKYVHQPKAFSQVQKCLRSNTPLKSTVLAAQDQLQYQLKAKNRCKYWGKN